jgi:Rha family phage regulatory protein
MKNEDMNQIAETSIHIFDRGSQLWTTSVDLARNFGKRHDNVIRDIVNLTIPDEFRLLNFEESSYLNEQGKGQPMYEMTRDGFTLLAMGFTGKKAMQWKIKYITAFNAMERRLLELAEQEHQRAREAARQARRAARQVQLEWQANRQIVREQRRETTDAIAALIEYARSQGSTSPDRVFFMSYSRMINHALFELSKAPKDFRDMLTVKQLQILSVAETIVAGMIREEIVKGTPYKGPAGIYEVVKARVARYAEAVGRVPLIEGIHGREERALAVAG